MSVKVNSKTAKELAQKRSEAARKANVTRKANALFAKRSEAALRGAQTRRANLATRQQNSF